MLPIIGAMKLWKALLRINNSKTKSLRFKKTKSKYYTNYSQQKIILGKNVFHN